MLFGEAGAQMGRYLWLYTCLKPCGAETTEIPHAAVSLAAIIFEKTCKIVWEALQGGCKYASIQLSVGCVSMQPTLDVMCQT